MPLVVSKNASQVKHYINRICLNHRVAIAANSVEFLMKIDMSNIVISPIELVATFCECGKRLDLGADGPCRIFSFGSQILLRRRSSLI
jgi:hypothetical protein